MDWINISDKKPVSGSRIWAKNQRGNATLGICSISRTGAVSVITETPGLTILNVQYWISFEDFTNRVAELLDIPKSLAVEHGPGRGRLINSRDKEISYWITSHSHYDSTNQLGFNWPIKPDPKMGEDFCKKIDAFFDEVSKWIQDNPERFKQAVLGWYKPIN